MNRRLTVFSNDVHGKGMVSLVLILLACFVRTGWLVAPDFSYLLLAVLAIQGKSQMLVALGLSWLFTMVNYSIIPWAPLSFAGRYLVIGASLARMLWSVRQSPEELRHPFVIGTLLFGFFVVVHTLVVSPMPVISLLKLGSWLATVLVLFHAWNGLEHRPRRLTADMVFYGLTLIALLSVPYIDNPIGYTLSKFDFQGVLLHPNSFGITMGLLGAWAFGRLLSTRRFVPLFFGVMALAVWLMVLSGSRTGGFAYLGGAVGAVIGVLLFQRKPLKDSFPALSALSFRILVGLVFVSVLVFFVPLRQQAMHFLSKSNRDQEISLVEAYQKSRAVLYNPILENISKTPWRGIGFGIASEPEKMNIRRDPWFGIPIGASVEKGNIFLAILEELGVFGLIAMLGWLVLASWYILRGGVTALAIFLTMLLINVGEAILFSPGGMGMVYMIAFIFAVARGRPGPERIEPQPGHTTIYFWQEMVSPHMVNLADELAARGYFVVYVASEILSQVRRSQGWEPPKTEHVRVILAPENETLVQVAREAPTDSIHLCQGLRGNGAIGIVQRELERRRLNQWIVMESVDDSGIAGVFKRLVYARLFHLWGTDIQGVLAIGTRTPEWVKALGVPGRLVYPFSYFIKPPSPCITNPENAFQEPFQFLYIGQLISRKQVDLLIRALAICSDETFQLTIVGEGPCCTSWQKLADELLPGRVKWIGRVKMREIAGIICKADCLVLPSRFDGWGVVVSEALLVGTPVICSDKCGAATAVEVSGVGGIFASGNVNALAWKLQEAIAKGPLSPDQRSLLAARTESSLGARVGAEYLEQILISKPLKTEQVPPPWESTVANK